MLYSTPWYGTVLYNTVLYCTVLYCIVSGQYEHLRVPVYNLDSDFKFLVTVLYYAIMYCNKGVRGQKVLRLPGSKAQKVYSRAGFSLELISDRA